MTEEEFGAHQRLERLQDSLSLQIGSSGRGLRDLAYVPLTPQILADVEICLRGCHWLAISTGLYVLQGLLLDREEDQLPPAFRAFLVRRVEELLDHPAEAVAHKAIDWFVKLRAAYPRYRERMLRALGSTSAEVRKRALRYYETYAHSGEVGPLMRFGNDSAARQLRPDGAWRFDLRDRALELVEERLGVRFERVLCTEPYRGSHVSWFDWSALWELVDGKAVTAGKARRIAT